MREAVVMIIYEIAIFLICHCNRNWECLR